MSGAVIELIPFKIELIPIELIPFKIELIPFKDLEIDWELYERMQHIGRT